MPNAKDLSRVRWMVDTGIAQALRERAGLSLAEMAEPVEVHRATIWRWEQKKRRPRGEAAIRYLRALEELSSV